MRSSQPSGRGLRVGPAEARGSGGALASGASPVCALGDMFVPSVGSGIEYGGSVGVSTLAEPKIVGCTDQVRFLFVVLISRLLTFHWGNLWLVPRGGGCLGGDAPFVWDHRCCVCCGVRHLEYGVKRPALWYMYSALYYVMRGRFGHLGHQNDRTWRCGVVATRSSPLNSISKTTQPRRITTAGRDKRT